MLVNRTFEKAQALAHELGSYFSGPRVLGPEARLEAVPWNEAALRQQIARIDLVVTRRLSVQTFRSPCSYPIRFSRRT